MKDRIDRLFNIMSVQSKSRNVTRMNVYITNFLNAIEGVKWYYHKGNIYARKGEADSYPCVVAHTDTVHSIIDSYHVYRLEDRMFAMNGHTGQQTGIGGDDKVGLFVALEMLMKHDVMKCAFFKDEEIGCIGSMSSNHKFFTNVEFVLQCDRKGYEDFVREIGTNELHDDAFSSELEDVMKKYGKKECKHGGSTDVGALYKRGVDVCMANISCGYYRPHTDNETIVISEVLNTLDFVDECIMTLKGKVWKNSNFGKKKTYSTHSQKSWSYQDKEWCNIRRKYVEKGTKIPCYYDYKTASWVRTDIDVENSVDQPCANCSSSSLEFIDFAGGLYCEACNTFYHGMGI